MAPVVALAGGPGSPYPLPGGVRPRPDRALRRLALVLLTLSTWLPRPAAAELSFIPLPAISTDPNAGPTYGLLPVFLFKDEDDRVKSIIAPSVTYNSLLGVNGTFRYFDYSRPRERFEFVAGYTETIERKLDIHYKNLGLFGERFHSDVELLFDRDATVLFFGLGPESKPANETNMTLQVARVRATVGVNITPRMRLSLGETAERFTVFRGAIPDVRFTGDRYPDLPGVDGATVHAQRVTLSYDDRDSDSVPTRGLTLSAYTEASAELLGSGADWIKGGAAAIYLHPFWDGRLILLVRGLFDAITAAADTPFEVLPTLGGATTLRGFSPNRFYGDARVLLNLEARVRVLKVRLFGFTSEVEVAPFVDTGNVFNSLDQLRRSGLQVTPGVGFRGIAPPSVVGHIELAVSREGPAVYVGLDYPF